MASQNLSLNLQVSTHEGLLVFRTVTAALISGFFASASSLPFDFVKTRIQKMKPDAQGKMPYSGLMDCAAKARSRELSSLWGANCFWYLES